MLEILVRNIRNKGNRVRVYLFSSLLVMLVGVLPNPVTTTLLLMLV
jgi:hypothetical protein